MIRENYASLGGWTLEEYLDYWEGERRVEKIIYSGRFKEFLEGGLSYAASLTSIKKPKYKKWHLLEWLYSLQKRMVKMNILKRLYNL